MPSSHVYTSVSDDDHLELPEHPNIVSSHGHGTLRFEWLDRTIVAVKNFFRDNYGLLLVVGSQAFLAAVNVAVKKLNSIDPPVPTLELILTRMAFTYVFSVAYMLYTKVPDPFLGPKGVRLLLAFRGFSGFFGMFGIYYALQYLSLSDAVVLTFLSPLCTAIAGSIFLKEKLTKREVFAGLLSLVGVVFIARPVSLFGRHAVDVTDVEGSIPSQDVSEKGTPTQRLIAVGVSLLGVLGSTGAYTTIRAIGKRAHALHSMMAFSLHSVVVCVIGLIATRTPLVIPTNLVWLALLLEIGVFGFLAQVLLTMGLQRETAGRGTMAIYTLIVFATIGERLFFHVVPSALSVFGTLIIIGSALYIALTKEREKTTTKDTAISLERLEDVSLEEGLLSHTHHITTESSKQGSVVSLSMNASKEDLDVPSRLTLIIPPPAPGLRNALNTLSSLECSALSSSTAVDVDADSEKITGACMKGFEDDERIAEPSSSIASSSSSSPRSEVKLFTGSEKTTDV